MSDRLKNAINSATIEFVSCLKNLAITAAALLLFVAAFFGGGYISIFLMCLSGSIVEYIVSDTNYVSVGGDYPYFKIDLGGGDYVLAGCILMAIFGTPILCAIYAFINSFFSKQESAVAITETEDAHCHTGEHLLDCPGK